MNCYPFSRVYKPWFHFLTLVVSNEPPGQQHQLGELKPIKTNRQEKLFVTTIFLMSKQATMSLQPHAVDRIHWHAKYLSLYLGGRKAIKSIIDEEDAKIARAEKKLERLQGRRAEVRHLVAETVSPFFLLYILLLMLLLLLF